MQLVSSEMGQSLQLINMDEIRPRRGGVFLPDFAREIVLRYRFQVFPERITPNQVVKFELGAKEVDGITIPISNLDVYADGILVNSYNTEDSNTILDDFLGWASETYHLRAPRTLIPRRYQSRLIVDLSQSAGDMLITAFRAVNAIVGKRLGAEQELSLTNLTIGPNPATQYPYLLTWLFQPRIGQPYVPNRYYSAAPLSTEDHFAMLQEIEAAVSRCQN
jgi:hypothetical protein